jgi:tryptophanyl-tRNA synthetase
MSLSNPEKKMSKSHLNVKSRILITSSKEEIADRMRAAVTDSEDGVSYDPQRRPQLANLLNILHYVQKDESISPEALARNFNSKQQLKEELTKCLEEYIAPIRERYLELMELKSLPFLEEVAQEGKLKARASAYRTLEDVHKALGLL